MAKDKNDAIVTDTKPDLTILNQWLAYAQGVAKRKQWDYFVIDQFLRGNQDIKGNPQDNSLTITKRTDKISYPINKLYTTFRAVRAFVTRHKPVVEIDLEEGSDESAKTYARRANKLLARDNKLNNFRKINKEWVYYGIKYGLGWRQVGFDPDKHVCIRWSVDPNDIVVGAPDGRVEDAPYIIKSVKRTVGYVKSKYKDNAKNISPDGVVATNEYKELGLQIQQLTGFSQKQTEQEDTVMLHECWYRLFNKNSKGGFVNKVVFTETEILGEIEETPYDEYPFIPYYSEITPNEIAGDGHLKHVIPAQRMLNLLNTQMLEYNHVVNKGRFLVKNNSGFKVISAKEGHIIKYSTTKPDVLSPPQISGMLDRQLTFALDFIEDLGGQHDASMGATPQRVNSGAAIEALQLGDSNNISDLRDNFEDALALEAAWILKMYALFEADGVKLTETVGKNETPFVAMGKVAVEKAGKPLPEKNRYYLEDNGSYCDYCTILADNRVKASVTSELGETKQARMELLFKLLDSQVISGKSVLRHLEFPNTQNIMQELAEEELAAVAIDQMKNPPVPPGMPPGAPPGAPGMPLPPPEGAPGEEIPTPPDEQMMGGLEALKGKLSQMQQEAPQ